MLKSIRTSKEATICKNSKVQRNYSNVLTDVKKLNREINAQIKKYEDMQTLSKSSAAQIRSR